MLRQDYFSRQALSALCEEIGMPDPFVEPLLEKLARLRTEVSTETLLAQCDPTRAQAVTNALCAQFEKNGQGLEMLALQLCAAEHTAELYDQKGICREIFTATMQCFSRFAQECAADGALRYDRSFWTWRQLSGCLFRLGTLEFERCVLSAAQATQYELNGETPVVSVHIPGDAVCAEAQLHASYRQARTFWQVYFAQQPPVVCRTWLLAAPLKSFLPEHSGIRTFQRDYRICTQFPAGKDYRIWLYGRAQAALPDAELPEDTSLQRRVKAHLLVGGTIGEGAGRLREESL